MPRRTCSPGPATSRRASSRFGRLRAEHSRRIRTSSASSGAACPTPRCPPGPTCPIRKCRISPTSSRRSPPTSRSPENVPKPARTPGRAELPRTSPSSSGRSSTRRPAASSATARSVGATALRLQRWWTTWGYPIRAANLAHSWTFRGGSTREDIFRTMTTGLNGSPMPSFSDALPPEQRWAITDFIVSLSGSNGPGYTNLVVAKHSWIRSIWRRGPRASSPLLSPAFRSSDRSWSPGARSILPPPP